MSPQNSTVNTADLSPRQQQVCRLVAQAKMNKEIAAELGLSDGTVKEYLAIIMRRTGARNRMELALRWWTQHASARDTGGRSDNMLKGEEVLAGKPLTRREEQVCALISRGMLTKEIACQLHLAPSSITQYTARSMRKLNVGNRVELTLRWLQNQAGVQDQMHAS
jgi:DNA-binding NarL/FixJ family response regulator